MAELFQRTHGGIEAGLGRIGEGDRKLIAARVGIPKQELKLATSTAGAHHLETMFQTERSQGQIPCGPDLAAPYCLWARFHHDCFRRLAHLRPRRLRF